MPVPGVPGGPELLIVLFLALLLFGASRIPKVAHALGRSTKEFAKGRAKADAELEEDKN